MVLVGYLAFFILLIKISSPAVVKNTSYTTSTGERVLRLELTIPLSLDDAWGLLTTKEGWQKWAAPVASVDLRVGGLILTNYDKTKLPTDSTSIRLPIINYIEKQMLTLKVILNDQFPLKVRQEGHNLQEVIQLVSEGKKRTKIVSSMIGWGNGPEWDKTYEFFSQGNEWSYQQLVNLFK